MSSDWIDFKEFSLENSSDSFRKPLASPLLISVPKRVVKLSTKRSRAKRLIREAIRLEKVKPPDGKGWKFIVTKPLPSSMKVDSVRAVICNIINKTE